MGDADSAILRLLCTPLANLFPGAPASKTSTAAKELAEWMSCPEYEAGPPEWAMDLIPCGDDWVCVHPDYPGMCLKISGPFEDSEPALAFAGMQSGYWKDRQDDVAVNRRNEIDQIMVTLNIED